MMSYYQFSQFNGAGLQTSDIVLEAPALALEELLHEIGVFFGGGRVPKCQLSASKLLKSNSKNNF